MLDARTLDATSLVPPSAPQDVPTPITYAELIRLGKGKIREMILAWLAEKAAIEQQLSEMVLRHPEAGGIMRVDARWGPGPTIGEGRLAKRCVRIFDPEFIEGVDAESYRDGAERLFEINTKIRNLVGLREAAA